MKTSDTATVWCPWCRDEVRHLIDEDDNYECSECHELNSPKPRFWED